MYACKYEVLNIAGMPVYFNVYNCGYACKCECLTMTFMPVNMKV
jgi:hypothetical protein